MLLTGESLRIDFSESSALEQAAQYYERFGCFIALNFVNHEEILTIRNYITRLIQLRREAVGLSPISNLAEFDSGFMELAQRNRADAAPIYEACRRLLPVHQLADSPRVANLSRFLMKTDWIMANREKQVRMDLPNEDKFLFDWHQDFPYSQDSEDALVYWFPLHDVDEKSGCLSVSPGSNRRGVQPVRTIADYAKDPNRSRATSLEIADLGVLVEFPEVFLPMKMGELLVFNTLVLHKSGRNRSNRTRWTVQFRHANFEHKRAVLKGWPGGVNAGASFEQLFPEYVADQIEAIPVKRRLP